MSKKPIKKAAAHTTTASPTDDVLVRARGVVETLNAAELRLGLAYRSKSDELAVVRSKRGDEVLDSADPDGAARDSGRQVSTLLQELDALADAARRARERRLTAIPAVIAAEADAKERQAEQLDADAAKLEAESNRLREVLERHDDWGFVPAQARIEGQYVAAVPHGDGGGFRILDARGPKFMRIRADAQALRTQAAQGRFRQPQRAGGLEADTVEQLLAAVFVDAMRVGPTVDAIIGWAEQATEKERRRRARFDSSSDAFVPAGAPMKLYIEWRGGVIDQERSRVLTPAADGIRANADSPATIATLGPLSDAPADRYQQVEAE